MFARNAFAVIVALAALALASCSYSPGSEIAVGKTILPPDGSIDQPIDVTVTVEFHEDISEPLDWMNSLMLKEAVDGETLCREVVYNAQGRLATCEHDDLEPGTIYHVIVNEILAVNGEITQFTTEE